VQGAAKLEQERRTEVARANVARETEEQRGKALAPAIAAAEVAKAEAEGKAAAVRIPQRRGSMLPAQRPTQLRPMAPRLPWQREAMLDAQAAGIQNLLAAFGGDSHALWSPTLLSGKG